MNRNTGQKVIISWIVLILLGIGLGFIAVYKPDLPRFITKKAPATSNTEINNKEIEIIELMNRERELHGIKELTIDSKLMESAMAKAEDMVSKGYFSHDSPGGKTFRSFITDVKWYGRRAGENIAKGYIDEDVVEAWMNSEGHRKNILAENYEEVGVSVRIKDVDGVPIPYMVVHFGDKDGK